MFQAIAAKAHGESCCQWVGVDNDELAEIFTRWNEGALESYLIEITANLPQAERDCFGAHTYQRQDAPPSAHFHTDWTGNQVEKEIDD